MKIIALGGSNSKNSINKKLAIYAASLFKNGDVKVLDVNDFELPLYSIDLENEKGIPTSAHAFASEIDAADLLVFSLAEHNGSYSAAFKNLIDWTSRIKSRKLFNGKFMLLMATSPGARGGMSVLNAAKDRFPFMGAVIKGTFSLPNFEQNFTNGKISNPELLNQLQEIVHSIESA